MLEITLKDSLYILSILTGVLGTYFMLSAKVIVLEERMRDYSKTLHRIFDMLERIEKKIDGKADK